MNSAPALVPLDEVSALRMSLGTLRDSIRSYQVTIGILDAVVESVRVQLADASDRIVQLQNENRYLREELHDARTGK